MNKCQATIGIAVLVFVVAGIAYLLGYKKPTTKGVAIGAILIAVMAFIAGSIKTKEPGTNGTIAPSGLLGSGEELLLYDKPGIESTQILD